jgi:hypothetical protein
MKSGESALRSIQLGNLGKRCELYIMTLSVFGNGARMTWFARLKSTPWYFKLFLIVLFADGLLSLSFLVPTLYRIGFSHLGNLWWLTLVLFFFLFPDNRLGLRAIRIFAVSIAVIYSISTVSTYFLDRGAHADYPWNPSFYFFWFHWVDGLIFPWSVAVICLILPKDAFPLRPPTLSTDKPE